MIFLTMGTPFMDRRLPRETNEHMAALVRVRSNARVIDAPFKTDFPRVLPTVAEPLCMRRLAVKSPFIRRSVSYNLQPGS